MTSVAMRLKRKREACINAKSCRRGDLSVTAMPVSVVMSVPLVHHLLQCMGLLNRVDDVVKLVDGSRRRAVNKRTEDEAQKVDDENTIWHVFDDQRDASFPTCLCSTPALPRRTQTTRDGDVVCIGCGVVVGVEMKETPWSNLPNQSETKRRGKAPPAWLVKRSNVSTADKRREALLLDEVTHWSHTAQLYGEDVAHAKSDALRMSTTAALNLSVAAACVGVILKKRVDASCLEAAMRRGEVAQSVHIPVPTARFSCNICQKRCHTQKEARFCCTI